MVMGKQSGQDKRIWDVVVIGGGPAGMMAAGRAAARGRSVLLLEKNPSPGKKLLLSGGGRCNFTNNKPDIGMMLGQYRERKKFLYTAFAQFGVTETLRFFRERGMEYKEENEGRMFPVSDRSQSVWDVLAAYMREGGVRVWTDATVKGVVPQDGHFAVLLNGGPGVAARAVVVATGGTSHPETGSSGDGFAWLQTLGHAIADNGAALVPVAVRDTWVRRLSGVALDDVRVSVFVDRKKRLTRHGRILFTHFGVSGPMILRMSWKIGEWLQEGMVELVIDLFPGRDHGAVKEALYDALTLGNNKKIKNVLPSIVPEPLVPAILERSGIDPETPCHSVRQAERKAIAELCKFLPMRVEGLLGLDKAVVSSGGVDPREVDFRTMESRAVPGLYLVGDMLDIDRPSGGYSLQLCWTTGFVAGNSV